MVDESFEEADKDMFDDVFGEDKERENARKKMKETIKEEKEKLDKKNGKVEGGGAAESEDVKAVADEEELVGVMKEVDEKIEEMNEKEEEKDVAEEPVKEIEKEEVVKEENEEIEETVSKKEPVKKKKRKIVKKVAVRKVEEEKVDKPKIVDVKKDSEEDVLEESLESKIKPELRLLEANQDNSFFIGRKKSVFDKYEDEAGLFIGRLEEEGGKQSNILLDGLNPHVVFVCGAKGSGKSYLLGVLAEELALKNQNVGSIVIDPVGVFWSMRHANKEKKELKLLKEWNLPAQGLSNIKVFIPEGMSKETPKGTYDALFSMQPSLLQAHDWCLTFGIERFSPTGLLLEKALSKVKRGYKDVKGKVFPAKEKGFGLDDIVHCLEHDADLNSKERGYKHDSIRALTSRFDAAKSWGVFSPQGTPLHKLSKENQLTIIDTSFLDDSVSALVIGILSRRILAARKLSTRREAAGKFDSGKDDDLEEFLESDIPATWLFIDEAHTLIPAGNLKTPASDALIEYVKQGRRPGCSLVFATQQPSAIDTKVLSQLDTIIAHKLVFNDDIKAIFKRTPTIIPFQYKRSGFIKTLPIGTALTGDRADETSRTFVMKIRPRMSQHEGREAETAERKKSLPPKLVARLAGEEAFYTLSEKKSLKVEDIEKILAELNEKYSSDAKLDAVLDDLMKRGAYLNDEDQKISLVEEEEEIIEEGDEEIGDEVGEAVEEGKPGETGVKEVEENIKEAAEDVSSEVHLFSFPKTVSQEQAAKLVDKHRKKGLLGLVGGKEFIDSVELKSIPVYKVEFNYYDDKKQFVEGLAYLNSLSGEFLHFKGKQFVESTGFKEFYDLSKDKIVLVNFIGKRKRSEGFLTEKTGFSKQKLERMLNELEKDGTINVLKDKKGNKFFALKKKFDLPNDLFHPLVSSISKVPVKESESMFKIAEGYSKKNIIDLLKKLWPNIVVQRVNEIYWPVYEGTVKSEKGKVREIYIDAVSGKKINPKN